MSNVPYLENTQVQTKELSDFWLAVYKLENDKNCDLIGVIPNGRKPPKLEGFLVYVDVICNQFLLSWCPRYFNYATFDDAVVKSAFSDHEVDEFRNEKNSLKISYCMKTKSVLVLNIRILFGSISELFEFTTIN